MFLEAIHRDFHWPVSAYFSFFECLCDKIAAPCRENSATQTSHLSELSSNPMSPKMLILNPPMYSILVHQYKQQRVKVSRKLFHFLHTVCGWSRPKGLFFTHSAIWIAHAIIVFLDVILCHFLETLSKGMVNPHSR